MGSQEVSKRLQPKKGFVHWGRTEEHSSAVHIPASYPDVMLPGIRYKHRLLVINLASVPSEQLVNSPTAQTLKLWLQFL